MIGGALIVGFCLLVLGWTAEIVGFFIKEPDLVSDGVRGVSGMSNTNGASRISHVPSRWQ